MFKKSKNKEKQSLESKKIDNKSSAKKTTKKSLFKKKDKENGSFKRIKGPKGKTKPIVNVKGVTKEYSGVTALNNISFELLPGERVGLIGGNGAGKTTISEIIVGLTKGTSGTIEYGFEYDKQPQEQIGMQFQDSNYPSGLTIKDIIGFAISVHKIKITQEELKKLLRIFQMEDFYNRPSRSLSGGQRQKLNILLSVLHKPKLVILDELSTGLDAFARDEIIKFTDELLRQNKISAILISHHTEEIERICDKVIALDHGNIVATSSIKDIQSKYGTLEKFMKAIIKEGNSKQPTLELSLDSKKSKKGKNEDKPKKSLFKKKAKKQPLSKDKKVKEGDK